MKSERFRNCNRCRAVFTPTVERLGGLLFCSVECVKAENKAKRCRQWKKVVSQSLPINALTSLDSTADISWLLKYRFASGVYFLIDMGEIVYVGKSVNVVARIAAGHADKVFDAIVFLPCPRENLTDTEIYWILKLRPKYNLQPY